MLNVELLPAQREFLTVPHEHGIDMACYQGGFGSGKTFAGALLGVLLCIQFPGIKGIVGSQVWPTCRDATLARWKKHLISSGLVEGVDWEYNETKQRLTFRNRYKTGRHFDENYSSVVFFKHFEDPDRLRSLEVGFIEIEEMSQIAESTFLELQGRLRQSELPDGTPIRMRLFGHTNPEANKGWIHKHFVERTRKTTQYEDVRKPADNGRDFRVITKVVNDEVDGIACKIAYRLIMAPTTQNKFLPASYVVGMKATFDPDSYRINVLGEFGDYSRGLVVKGYDSDRQIIDYAYDPTRPLHLTMDFNRDPMCWLVAQKDDHCVYFMDELIVEHTHTKECIEMFVNRYPPSAYPTIVLNGDASGGWGHSSSPLANLTIVENYLRGCGYRIRKDIPPRNPDIDWRIESWNAMMLNALGEHRIYFAGYLNSEGEMIPKTPRLIYSVCNLKYKQGTGDIDKPTVARIQKDQALKFLDHPFDAGSYLVWQYFPIRMESYTSRPNRQSPADPRFNITGN